MFVELIDERSKKLQNLDTGTGLVFERFTEYSTGIISYSVSLSYGLGNSFMRCFEGDKAVAEALYTRIRNQWIKNEYVEIIRK